MSDHGDKCLKTQEQPVVFKCCDEELIGIIHAPEPKNSKGVLIVVGGPQYRVGSHRQFVLLARFLSQHNIPVMRFDYRSMGDSEGDGISFENIDDDIRNAIDTFFSQVKELREIIIWGLCDAASAAMMYAATDSRVSGLVLVNPWVRTESSIARTYLKHYYLSRLFDWHSWGRLLRGNIVQAAQSFSQMLLKGIVSGRSNSPDSEVPYTQRMLRGLQSFEGQVLLILSGQDYTASEFKDTVADSKAWSEVLERKFIAQRELPEANHTFATRAWRDQVADWTMEWLESW